MNIGEQIAAGVYDNKFSYHQDKEKYREEERRLKEEFLTDLQGEIFRMGVPEEYCIGTVDYAWDEGHSGGYTEVYSIALEIATRIFKV